MNNPPPRKTARRREIIWDGRNPFKVKALDDIETIAEAKEWHETQFREGEIVECKCCGQTVKAYPRMIYQKMVEALALLYADGPMTSQVLAEKARVTAGGGDYHKLQEWGLVTFVKGHAEEPDRYAITPLGRAFLMGRVSIPRYLAFYRGEVWGHSREQVFVKDCLKKEFSMHDILNPLNIRGYDDDED